ncbi:hypothetical protein ACIXT9_02305 [Bacteroides fragilis]
MSDDLLELAESGEWRERAIELLQRETNAGLLVILEFVDCYWQNLASDEKNIEEFREFESELT